MVSLDLRKAPYIQDLQLGLLEEGYFLIRRVHLNQGRKNKPFLRLLLADKTGHLPAVYFGGKSEVMNICELLSVGDVVKVSGVIEEFMGITQLKLLKIEASQKSQWDLSRFWKRTRHDRRLLLRELIGLMDGIKNKSLLELSQSILKDMSFLKLFLESPASRFAHHAYIGGLLEHTLNVTLLCKNFARMYPSADADLLIAGALLHDVGKVDEFEFLLHGYDYSDPGRLKGHTLLGYDRIVEKLKDIEIEKDLRLKFEHIILSHQGKKEWGAVTEPRFLEAYLVHAADSVNASAFLYSNAKRSAGTDSRWSQYNTYLGREIYLG